MPKGMKDCCCSGCAEVPWNRALGGAPENVLQPVQQYCCACVPKYLCMGFEPDNPANDGESGQLIELKRPCDPGPPEDYTSVYRGQIAMNGELRDVELAFVVEDATCYLAFTSDYFGADGLTNPYYRLELTPGLRQTLCGQCENCNEEIDDAEIEYIDFDMITTPYAGTFRFSGIGHMSVNPPKARCAGCPDPCDDPYAEGDEDCRSRCKPCGGCACICRRACITVNQQGSTVTYEVDACDLIWAMPNGMSISLVAGDDDCCELSLDPGSIVPNDPIANVGVGDNTTNPCPHPSVKWEFTDSGKNPPEDWVVVTFNCAGCGGCLQQSGGSCCSDTVPSILTASVDGGSECCGAFDITLVYDPVGGEWVGEHATAMCEHGIKLTLGCTAGGVWQLDFEGSPCTAQSDTDSYFTCDPLSASFSIPAQGIGCCDIASSGTLTITVTE